MHPIAGVSVLLATVSFVLVMLTIFAGNKADFMEDYHVLYFNTSTLGQNLVPSLKVRAPMPEPTAPPSLLNRFHASSNKERGLGDIAGDLGSKVNSVKGDATSAVADVTSKAASAATNAVGDVTSALSGIENDLADEMAKKLGIKEFYSIHLIDLCDGDFEPNATNPDATFNVTNCTTAFDYDMLNISALLDHELSVGPFSLNLADLGFTKDIQSGLDIIPKAIKAIVAMYIIAAIFIGLNFFASIGAALLIPNSGVFLVMANLGLAGFAVLFLLVGNLVTTIGGSKVVDKVTEHGNGIGLYAEQGGKFIAMTWATFALMLLSVFYWVYEFFAQKKFGHNRSIGGDFSKSEPVSIGPSSRTSSGFSSQGSYSSTNASADPTMKDVELDEDFNERTGAHGPQPFSPPGQISHSYGSSYHSY